MAVEGSGTETKRTPRSAVLDARPEYERLGLWLRKQREAAGLLQRPVSRALGKPEQFINKVEHGKQRIDLVEFLDLCTILKLDRSLSIEQILDVVMKGNA